MASGSNPEDRSRFAKLGMAINEELTQACRDVLEMEVPPGLVYNKVKASSIYKKIRPEQELCVIGAKTDGYKEFDITLLYTLIRNICTKIPRPTKGWGGNTMPSVGEIMIGDDIERIRLIRNTMFGHISSASTSQTDFDDTWSSITNICKRLQTYTNKDYMSGLSNIQSQALEEENVKYVLKKLEEQYKNNQCLMEMVSSVEEHVIEKVSCVEEHVVEKMSAVEKHMLEKVSSAEKHVVGKLSSVGERVVEKLSSMEQHVLELKSKSHKKDKSLYEDILESWRKEDSKFVPTAASEYVEEKIKSQNLVTVVGNSGCGKTAIIQHIALKLKEEKGWDIRPVDEVKEIKQLCSFEISSGNPILFLLNDPIGMESLDDISYNSWKTYEKTLEICLKKVKLLVSCRRCVINDKKLEGILKRDSNKVEIDSEKLKLSAEEKRQILNKYCQQIEIPEGAIREIMKTEAYFPLLCKVFSCELINEKNIVEEGINLFKNPFLFIKQEIEHYKTQNKHKYCALLLIMAFNNNLNVHSIKKDEISLKTYKNIIGVCELPNNIDVSVIGRTLHELKGSYVKCVGHRYKFLHDFIMEIVTLVFGVDCPQETIQYAESGFLRRRVKIEDDTEEDDCDPFTVYLPEEYIDDLVDRFMIDMQTENLVDVFLNPCLRKDNVIKSFKEKVDSIGKILVRIKCEIDRSKFSSSFEGCRFTRLGFLDWKDETCPLIGFIIFCHNDISSFFLKTIDQTTLKDCDCPIFPAVCANGNSNLLNSISKEYKKSAINEMWDVFLPIHVASVFHNFSIIEELVRLGANVNKFTTDDRWTPLLFAAANDEDHFKEAGMDTKPGERRNETIMCLLNNGADINLCNNYRISPLYIACQNGHHSTVQLLLNNGANINLCKKNGISPLHIACNNGHDSTVQLLLNNGADINLCANDEDSPLCIACNNGHDSTVQLLLNNGADINLCDNDGDSPLHIACNNGHDSTVQLLMNNGANINLCEKNGTSPLHIACNNGHDSTVQLLLNNGANINLCEKNGTSPLQIACINGHDSTVQLLLNNGADINLCENDGDSPLYIACQNGHDSTVQLLLNNGADINLCDNDGDSPLYIACQNGHDSTVQLLLNNGADINLCNKNGASPLYIACQNGHDSTVQLLLNNCADINSFLNDRTSPLYIACQNGHDSTVKLLLNNGADINLCDNDGCSPLYIACQNEHDSTVQLLLNNGAGVNVCNKNGESPLSIAKENGHDTIVQLLIDKGAL